MSIALFHFHVSQIKRSSGQSAVAAAAYRAGEELHSEYYGEDSDYTHKGGVICSEILLPSHAPAEYADRENLWNAVEKVERGKKAQLAYSFDIALQNELSMEENIYLARQFLLENFVNRGMIVDFAIHSPDKKDGISNPHFHVLCPIRPINPDGTWGNKQRREYVLDESGQRIRDGNGDYVFNAVPTTDWGSPGTLEAWRQAWADLCNAKFAEKELNCRIDHRSYERQGMDQLPTIHEGPTVRAMETDGIRTDKGDFNRWIRKTNAMLREAKQKIAALLDWLKSAKAELSQPRQPTLVELLSAYYESRNKGAYSNKAKVANLKKFSEAVNYLEAKQLCTPDDLEALLDSMQDNISTIKAAASQKQARIKELDDLLRMARFYADGKPVADKLSAIKWKGKREQFMSENENALRLYHMAERKLKPYFKEGKLPITAWRTEKEKLKLEYQSLQQELTPLYADTKKLWAIHYQLQEIQHEQQQNAHIQKQETKSLS